MSDDNDGSLTLVLTRDLDAPRELVYRAWTEPARLAEWCMPQGFSVPFAESDIRAGGHYRTCLKAPDGVEHRVRGTYTELAPPARIVFTHAWELADGGTTVETLVTITLEELGAKRTRLVLKQTGFDDGGARDGHGEGWSETLDALAGYCARQAA